MTSGSGFLTSPPTTIEPHSPLASPTFAFLRRALFLVDGALVLLMAGVVFTLGCQELSDSDVWWHVRTGQWIWSNQTVPTHDLVHIHVHRQPLDLTSHRLFQVWLAAAFVTAGVPGMILMAAGVWTVVVLVAFMAGRRRWPVWVATVCWLPAIVVMSSRFIPRPEVFSLLGVALYLAILLRTDDTPQLTWILPFIQVLWVNAHGLFMLGPAILVMYLADRLVRMHTSTRNSQLGECVPGATVGGDTSGVPRCWLPLLGLANPYGLRGALLPLELFPKITAWGGQAKSYIIENGDLREFVRKQGLAAASSLYLRGECFLLWVMPLSFIVPAAWRTGRAGTSSLAWTRSCLGAFALAVSLVLASALGFPGPGTPAWLVWAGRRAPVGLVMLGALSAAILIRSSRWTAVLAVMGGVSLGLWVLWLRTQLFGLEPGPGAWFGGSEFNALGWSTVLIGGATAALLLRTRARRFFAMALAVSFSYLALQAIRNINLFGLVAGFVTTWNVGRRGRPTELHPFEPASLSQRP